ncbi:MAG TPA: hypothetical protein VLV28_05475 [Gaiellaceae bacterium]|nr:hypothetical protein [Gaiellaceae bacterium]
MKLIRSKKGIALLAALAVIAVSAVGAYAYFTSAGSGTGSATVGAAANNLVVTGTPDSTALTPGGTGSVISFKVDNPAGFNQYITNIHLSGVVACSVALVSNACPAGPGNDISTNDPTETTKCYVGAFTMPNVTGISDGNIAPNAPAQSITETGTLSMADSGYDQGACENAHLALSFTTT